MSHLASPSSDEHTLISRAKSGDGEALGMLLEQNRPRLEAYAFRKVHDRQLAEDLVQELFMRVIRNIEKFDTMKELSPWLYRILNRIIFDQHRRTERRPRLIAQDAFDTGLNVHEGVDYSRDPSRMIWEKERAALIQRALLALTKPYRETVLLIFMDNKKYHEAAEQLAIPIGTVKSRIHKALLRLNETLQSYEEIA